MFQTRPLVEVDEQTGSVQLHHCTRHKKQRLFRCEEDGMYVWDKLDKCERRIPWDKIANLLDQILGKHETTP